jgi:hypothetical protein
MNDQAKLREALEMLYTARWNIPRAADYCGIPHHEMKTVFAQEATVGRLLPKEWGYPPAIQLSLGL